jgi:hypothetical protein
MNKSSSSNIDTLKKEMIKALHETLGVVSPAADMVGIHRSTHYNWMNNDEYYKKEVESVQNFQLDFVESKLFENVNSNDTTAIIFYLKTRGRDRGYIEKQDIKIQTEQPIFKGIDLDVPTDDSSK